MSKDFECLKKLYNEKYPKDHPNWKKIRALVNFSKAQKDVKIWEELEFIVRFYLKGFIWEEQEALLDRILLHYDIDYTKWAIKDGWVKAQIFKGQRQSVGILQLEFPFFDFDKERHLERMQMLLPSKLERNKYYQPRMI